MTMLQIFANKDWTELAVAISNAPGHDAKVQLHRAGVPASEHDDFLRIARSFRALREHAHCSECTDREACLDDNTLAEFVDGVVPEHMLPEVEQKLAHCGACLHKALELAHLANELAPPPSLPAVVIAFVKQGFKILSHPLQGFDALELQPVAMMSGEDGQARARCWSQVQGDYQGVFTMAADKAGAVSLHVRFLRNGSPAAGSRIALRSQDLLLESQMLPESGEHFFLNLSPAPYAVEVEDELGSTASFLIALQEVA